MAKSTGARVPGARVPGARIGLAGLATAALLALSLAACSNTPSSSGSSAASSAGPGGASSGTSGSRPVNVGYTIHPAGSKLSIAFIDLGESNTYGAKMASVASAWAAANDVNLTVFDANFSADTELDLIQDAISSGKYNAIATLPLDPNLLCNILSKKAPAANIMVSLLNTPICGAITKVGDVDAGWTPGTLNVSYPGALGSGVLALAQKCATLAPGPQKVAMITGPPTAGSTIDALEAFRSIPTFTITQDLITPDFSDAAGVSLTQTALESHPDTTIVFTVGGPLSVGVASVLRSEGLSGKVKICGLSGGTTQDIAALKAGEITVEEIGDPQVFVTASLLSLKDAWDGMASPRVITLSPAGQVAPYTTPEILTPSTASEMKNPY